MIYTYQINGIDVKTGDIICARDGKRHILPGEYWRLIGKLIPGKVEHNMLYLGPEGRCLESGPNGVHTFEMKGGIWDAEGMAKVRGSLIDVFYGIAYPFGGRGFSEEEENEMRQKVVEYALKQLGKPYNLHFMHSETEEAFYCSQLVYKAYQQVGINLNTEVYIKKIPGSHKIIFPQEVWNKCEHKRFEGESK